jgi:crossover junction endodeoxyribonuclease RuvC
MEKTLGIKMESSFMDASDALAIAMCHFYQLTNPLMDVSASSNWKSFIESHPTRVKK